MTKITLSDVASLSNEGSTVALLNSNSAIVETASDKFVYRDGTAPNQMLADFDMNSHKILNLPTPVDPTDVVRLEDVSTLIAASGLPGVGTVTSVGLSTPSAFTVSGSPITGSGTLALTFNGANDNLKFLRADNVWAVPPGTTAGGGTVNSGTTGQLAYYGSAGTTLSGNPTTITSTGDIKFPTFNNAIWMGGSRFIYSNDPGGANSIFIGNSVGNTTTLSTESICIGFINCNNLTTGAANIAIGGGALTVTTIGNYNHAIGQHAMKFNIAGSDNVVIGHFANNGNSGTVPAATFTGSITGSTLTVTSLASGSITVGQSLTCASITDGHVQIIALGTGTGGAGTYTLNISATIASQTINASRTDLSQSVCVGSFACNLAADPDLPGFVYAKATAVGYLAYQLGTTGVYNVAVGANSLAGGTGSYNTAIGAQSFQATTTANNNTGVGYATGTANITGASNTYIGYGVGLQATSSSNVAVGALNAFSLTTGTFNVFLGTGDPGITTGNYNLILGNATALTAGLASNIILADGQGNIRDRYNVGWAPRMPQALTFSTLPTALNGMEAYITDALAGSCGDGTCLTIGTTVTGGGGALKRLVWYNGTNWTIIGK